MLLRRLRVNDASSGRHPLDAASGEMSGASNVISVLHGPGQHVGHRLKPAVGMVGKPGDIVGTVVGLELVEEQEGIEVVQLGGAQRSC